MNIKKSLVITFSLIAGLFLTVTPALAHVSVKPGEVGVGERINFSVSVPTEEEDPTIQVRLVLPEGLQSITPFVKPGWNIELKKTGEGDEAKVIEIIWSGGSIPAEQKDEFVFSAQAPAEETSLIWKAYQTYGDGDIVAWENSPDVVQEYTKNNPPQEGQEDDHNAPRPYSETKVINDLKGTDGATQNTTSNTSQSNSGNTLSIVAIVLSIAALGVQFLKKDKAAKR